MEATSRDHAESLDRTPDYPGGAVVFVSRNRDIIGALSQIHTQHPPCPACGKALYKSPKVGARVDKRDKYAWCRNAACRLHGRPVWWAARGLHRRWARLELDRYQFGPSPTNGETLGISGRSPYFARGPSVVLAMAGSIHCGQHARLARRHGTGSQGLRPRDFRAEGS